MQTSGRRSEPPPFAGLGEHVDTLRLVERRAALGIAATYRGEGRTSL